MRLFLSRERLKKQIRLKKEKLTDVLLAFPRDLESPLSKVKFASSGLMTSSNKQTNKQKSYFHPPNPFIF